MPEELKYYGTKRGGDDECYYVEEMPKEPVPGEEEEEKDPYPKHTGTYRIDGLDYSDDLADPEDPDPNQENTSHFMAG